MSYINIQNEYDGIGLIIYKFIDNNLYFLMKKTNNKSIKYSYLGGKLIDNDLYHFTIGSRSCINVSLLYILSKKINKQTGILTSSLLYKLKKSNEEMYLNDSNYLLFFIEADLSEESEKIRSVKSPKKDNIFPLNPIHVVRIARSEGPIGTNAVLSGQANISASQIGLQSNKIECKSITIEWVCVKKLLNSPFLLNSKLKNELFLSFIKNKLNRIKPPISLKKL